MLKPLSIRVGRKKLRFKLNRVEKQLIVDEIFYSQNYFPKISRELDFKIKPQDTVIDIGANVGIFSVFAANLANRGRVFAFEPVKENFKRLEYHKQLNRLNNLVIENKGVSDKRKKAKIYLLKTNTGGHSLHKEKIRAERGKIRGTEIIECIPLREIFDSYKIRRCDFLKLDCEGEEYKILTALPTNYFKKIEKIALEYHRPAVDEVALAKFLGQRDFVVTITYYGRWLGGMIFAKKKFKASQ